MKIKQFIFETKNVDLEERIVEGYASTFGNIDLGSDVVAKGAFLKSIEERLPKKQIKVLWQHYDPIGIVVEMREDDRGLWVKCKISKTRLGDEALQLAADGVISSFSIGYETIKADTDSMPGVRILKELKLYEVSLVTFPMNEQAMITAVKDISEAVGSIGTKIQNPEFAKKLHDVGVMLQMAAGQTVDSKSVVPFQDHAISDTTDEFDAKTAVERLKLWALDGDSVDVAKYKTAFVIGNADAPNSIDSYSVPVADVIDGSLAVTAASLKNAADTIHAGNADDADIAGARAHLEQYFAKHNENAETPLVAPWSQFEDPKSTEPEGKKEGRVLSVKNTDVLTGALGKITEAVSEIEALIDMASQPLANTGDDDDEPQEGEKGDGEKEAKSIIDYIKQFEV